MSTTYQLNADDLTTSLIEEIQSLFRHENISITVSKREPADSDTEAGAGDSIVIHGEPFIVSREDGNVVIHHRKWSLLGSGATIADAKTALLEEADEVADFFLEFDEATLAPDVLRFRHFLETLHS